MPMAIIHFFGEVDEAKLNGLIDALLFDNAGDTEGISFDGEQMRSALMENSTFSVLNDNAEFESTEHFCVQNKIGFFRISGGDSDLNAERSVFNPELHSQPQTMLTNQDNVPVMTVHEVELILSTGGVDELKDRLNDIASHSLLMGQELTLV